mmetsp:Transcript_25681/g.64678  ORF Transcript_25681/g.64678 Transcript_25681/m.64678 type:complete len:215 (-) Transcript_25681:3283-3927(-)
MMIEYLLCLLCALGGIWHPYQLRWNQHHRVPRHPRQRCQSQPSCRHQHPWHQRMWAWWLRMSFRSSRDQLGWDLARCQHGQHHPHQQICLCPQSYHHPHHQRTEMMRKWYLSQLAHSRLHLGQRRSKDQLSHPHHQLTCQCLQSYHLQLPRHLQRRSKCLCQQQSPAKFLHTPQFRRLCLRMFRRVWAKRLMAEKKRLHLFQMRCQQQFHQLVQ